MKKNLTRRKFLTAAPLVTAGLWLGACDQRENAPAFRKLLDLGRSMTMHGQRLILQHKPLVRELRPDQISAYFQPNGTAMPAGDVYKQWLENDFRDWRLQVDGLVDRPLSLSLDQLKAMPARTQITQHNCDEGWTAVGQWTGVPLGHVLQLARLQPDARFIIFHCADNIRGTWYYESIDLFDAFHPQTILAYGMNGGPVPVGNGAPLRLRVELQIGYKNAKYLKRIEVASSLAHVGGGEGGYWEDKGFQWYAGL